MSDETQLPPTLNIDDSVFEDDDIVSGGSEREENWLKQVLGDYEADMYKFELYVSPETGVETIYVGWDIVEVINASPDSNYETCPVGTRWKTGYALEKNPNGTYTRNAKYRLRRLVALVHSILSPMFEAANGEPLPKEAVRASHINSMLMQFVKRQEEGKDPIRGKLHIGFEVNKGSRDGKASKKGSRYLKPTFTPTDW